MPVARVAAQVTLADRYVIIAKQIIEMHGGRIWVESTPGKGRKLSVELTVRAEYRKDAP